jgi:acyl carrier protein
MKPGNALITISALVLATVLVISIIFTTLGFMAKETLGLVFFIVVSSGVIAAIVQDRIKKRRIAGFLAPRPTLSDDQFAHAFFAQDPEHGAIASRVRRVLATNLSQELERLNPEDRLNEDLDAELESNPDLFWELEQEFGIKTDVDDLESHAKTLERLVTFGDLVNYIATLVRERPAVSQSEELPPPSRFYGVAFRSIPIFCLAGFGVIAFGAFVQRSVVMKLGTGLFLFGFAVWALANGGVSVWELIQTVRADGLKELTTRPWSTLFRLLFAVFLLVAGGFFVWTIAKPWR